MVHRFNQENWESLVLKSEKPVFVDFVIPDRRPAHSLNLLELHQEWEDLAEVGYLDVSRDLSLALKYPVVDLPTLYLFYQGKVLKSFLGSSRFRQNFRELFFAFTSKGSSLASMTMIIGKPFQRT